MEKELFFVGIDDPIEMRKELLISSKNLIDSLRRYEAYGMIREEKMKHAIDLKRVFDELLVLNRKLRSGLPKVPIKVPKPTRSEKKGKKGKQAAPPKKSKLQMLEAELMKVEERLSNLR